jgi:hypothetical protein
MPPPTHCPPKTSVLTRSRLDEILLRPAAHTGAGVGPFGPPGTPRGPLQPSHLAQISKKVPLRGGAPVAGRPPLPRRPPLGRRSAAPAGATRDNTRGTPNEVLRSTPDHILVPPAATGSRGARPITKAAVVHQDLGLSSQDHFPTVTNLHVHLQKMPKRRRKRLWLDRATT